ncbi:MAG TPA: nucleotide exchange factor GrpE [Gaiellaceae bacterium]
MTDESGHVRGTVPETGPKEPAEQQPDPLAEVTRERDEYLDALQRLKAEFDNYRKRAARDQEQLVARAHERLAKELLPVLDDLERALAAAEDHEEAQLEEGVRLVHRSLVEALEKEGVAEIETDGRFDPHVHEALLSQPDDEKESGAILDVLQKGYRIGNMVIRPARVIVVE